MLLTLESFGLVTGGGKSVVVADGMLAAQGFAGLDLTTELSRAISSDHAMPKIVCCGKSDVGLKRSNNEDAFLIQPELNLGALADGMGGAAAGELASQFFAQTALEVFSASNFRSEDEGLGLIQKSYELANERILNHIRENPHHRGMGCTAELLVFFDEKFALGHVGDSRTYLYRKGHLKQLTRDHSLVQDQVDQGLITLVEARRHPLRHVILRAVGTAETLAVDLIRGAIHPSDLFLLCSDGLSDMIEDSSIEEILALPLDITEKAERLIESAKSAGGHDNVTVVLSKVIQ